MNHVRIKLTIGAIALAVSVALLAFAGVRQGLVYFLPVDEFLADTSRHNDRVRLHGTVSDANFEANPSLLSAHFDLLGEAGGRIRVRYAGVLPDMFKAGNDVVVEGRLAEDGEFSADTLMTKCASKYESTDGQAPHADPRTAQGAQR